MVRLGATVHGVDISEKNIEVARQQAKQSGLAITYDVATAETLVTNGHQYEVVLNMGGG